MRFRAETVHFGGVSFQPAAIARRISRPTDKSRASTISYLSFRIISQKYAVVNSFFKFFYSAAKFLPGPAAGTKAETTGISAA